MSTIPNNWKPEHNQAHQKVQHSLPIGLDVFQEIKSGEKSDIAVGKTFPNSVKKRAAPNKGDSLILQETALGDGGVHSATGRELKFTISQVTDSNDHWDVQLLPTET